MFEDFEFNPTVAIATAAFWLITMAFIWKVQLFEAEWGLVQKIVISIVSLPAYYLIINLQVNR